MNVRPEEMGEGEAKRRLEDRGKRGRTNDAFFSKSILGSANSDFLGYEGVNEDEHWRSLCLQQRGRQMKKLTTEYAREQGAEIDN